MSPPARGAAPGGLRRLGLPQPVAVRCGPDGPLQVSGRCVESVCEEWVVEDLWWTGRPLRRRYLELVLEDGRNIVVFRDVQGGGWFLQRA